MVEGKKSHDSTIKMSLSATFDGWDWKTGDNPPFLCVHFLIMAQHVGEDKHESRVETHDKMDQKDKRHKNQQWGGAGSLCDSPSIHISIAR